MTVQLTWFAFAVAVTAMGWIRWTQVGILERIDEAAICAPAWRLDTTARLERVEKHLEELVR